MDRLIFLTGSFYPDFSAVSSCGYQLQKGLSHDFEIHVLSVRTDRAQSLEEDFEGIRVHRVETSYMRCRNALKDGAGRAERVLFQALRAWGAVKRLLSPETIDGSLVTAYLERLQSMETPPTAIVPLVFPYESVLAALAYKKTNPTVAVYPYVFDDFVDSGSLHVLKAARQLKRAAHLRLERRMLEEADAVLAMHPLREHFKRHFDHDLTAKITFLEHPLLVRPRQSARRSAETVARLCFAGSLIKDVREADHFLELLRAAHGRVPIWVDFYVAGNAAHKVRSGAIGEGAWVINHGWVPKPQADAAVQNSDILINLGDAQGTQVASKVFEYMATGKPIIHLAVVRDDAVTKILTRYPLALCLVQSTMRVAENARRLANFVDQNRRRSLTFAEVAALYPEALPSTTVKIFKSLLSEARIENVAPAGI